MGDDMTTRVQTPSGWSTARPCRVWDGTEWLDHNIRVFDGADWRQMYSRYESAVLADHPVVYYRFGEGTDASTGATRYNDYSGNAFDLIAYPWYGVRGTDSVFFEPEPFNPVWSASGALPNDTNNAFSHQDITRPSSGAGSGNSFTLAAAQPTPALDAAIGLLQPSIGFATEFWHKQTFPKPQQITLSYFFNWGYEPEPISQGVQGSIGYAGGATERLNFRSASNVNLPVDLPLNQWQHIVCNWGTSAISTRGFWINGDYVAPPAAWGNTGGTARSRVFSLPWAVAGYIIDELAVYSYHLTESQIQAHYDAALLR